jgi:hypothetical protein
VLYQLSYARIFGQNYSIFALSCIIFEMPKSRIILVIGFCIALLPMLGFPHAWESFFQVVGGLGIVLLSVMIAVDKRLTQKAKAERRLRRRREKVDVEVVAAEAPLSAPPGTNEESPIQ